MSIRAVIDTSSLVSSRLRRELREGAALGLYTAIWSPWIIAEMNRVLTRLWLCKPPSEQGRCDCSQANRGRCGESAKRMMELLLPAFELGHPLPPYPVPWETLKDAWDVPIWAAARLSGAQHVVSENTLDYPPAQPDGRDVHEGIEYPGGDRFLALISNDPEA